MGFTSPVVTLEEIDQAWFNYFGCSYSGNKITTSKVTIDNNPVELFIGRFPHGELADDRVFPSISINFLSMAVDRKRKFSKTEDGILVSDTPDPPNANIVVTYPDPEPYYVIYYIHTWARKTVHDRKLMQGLIANILVNDTLNINNEDWVVLFSVVTNSDQVLDDQTIYHKTWTARVEVDMQPQISTTSRKVSNVQNNDVDFIT
tara:strand:- start:1007 stop:1618 length:612 start_codon:yes stop_codon:yes gene_type:complete